MTPSFVNFAKEVSMLHTPTMNNMVVARKMIKYIFLFIFICSSLFVTGCADDTSKIIGYWKSKDMQKYTGYDKFQIYHITKDSVTVDNGREHKGINWHSENAKIVGSREGWSFTGNEFEIQIVDKDRIRIWRNDPMTSINADGDEFIRITNEEATDIISSPGKKREYKVW